MIISYYEDEHKTFVYFFKHKNFISSLTTYNINILLYCVIFH